ncbi:MAG: AI-2E family transporter [Thermoleophilia bacterium]|nr:AI-2E family transporter [Thermoleophilia bacterium]
MTEERLVRFRPRAIMVVIAIVLATVGSLWLLWLTKGVVLWILIAVFLATALNPAVDAVMRRGVRRRGIAVGIVFVAAVAVVVGIGATFVPTLVREVNDLADAIPGYIEDVTKGRGPLGFLERDYQIVERVREAIDKSGVGGVLGLSSTALGVARSVVTAVVATVTIAFLTLFMLLEGPAWVERGYGLVPERHRARARSVGADVYRAVGGYVMGNLAISLIAGAISAVVFTVVGLPFPFALALVVALLDLIPLAGATIAAVIVTTIAFIDSTTSGVIVLVFFVVYQQLENHVLQPVVYGKAVKLSPLSVLVAVLIGAELAGIVGALGAIPVAAAIQVLVRDLRRPATPVPEQVELASGSP